MGLEKKSALLEDLIEKCGGCAVVDGGFATQLEIHGAAINDPLWSAVSLIKDPELIKRVHMEYLEAGADVVVTSSYQSQSYFGRLRDFDSSKSSIWVHIGKCLIKGDNFMLLLLQSTIA
ncbi:hypothetical protein DY000_02025284 [Brassica cretica]|uniref:Hcy-binding domain-containing protein n=1 Tax=Brassica cretica TaxID=69181 RepID=A0ABQ7E8V1_BRACR|nr:hypothetical protein DY000_02025284 [Brassica cretica]